MILAKSKKKHYWGFERYIEFAIWTAQTCKTATTEFETDKSVKGKTWVIIAYRIPYVYVFDIHTSLDQINQYFTIRQK